MLGIKLRDGYDLDGYMDVAPGLALLGSGRVGYGTYKTVGGFRVVFASSALKARLVLNALKVGKYHGLGCF